jgi:hypothetical protein
MLNFVVFWDVTQSRLISHRRFGTKYQSYLQGSICPSWSSWPSKMVQIRSPETSERNQPSCITSKKTTEFRQSAGEAYDPGMLCSPQFNIQPAVFLNSSRAFCFKILTLRSSLRPSRSTLRMEAIQLSEIWQYLSPQTTLILISKYMHIII